MYLEELARVLHDEFDEWVSVATLSRYLKKEGWVKEKVHIQQSLATLVFAKLKKRGGK
jgi:arginine repressor